MRRYPHFLNRAPPKHQPLRGEAGRLIQKTASLFDLLLGTHAIGKLARPMESSDAATPFYQGSDIGVLREHEAGVKTAELCRKHGVSDATLYNWTAKYGGMTVSEAARLRTLEDENRRLKKLLSELTLDVSALKDLLKKADPVCGSLRCGGEADDRHGLHWPAAGGSGSSTPSTTTAGSGWRAPSTPPCQVGAWSAN